MQVDNAFVRKTQIEKLERLRAERDEEKTQAALTALRDGAKGKENLLALAVNAARAKATVGEMSKAMENVFTRYQASVKTVTGVYGGEMGQGSNAWGDIRARVEAFESVKGRKPKLLVAKMGQDGHDRGQKVVASASGDMGFDVNVGVLFQTPEEVAEQAIENGVDVVGISTLTAGHLTLIPQLKAVMEAKGAGNVRIVVGGVIPPQDFDALYKAGASAIFPPGTVLTEAAGTMLDLLETKD